MQANFEALRSDYQAKVGRSLSLPISGAIIWALVGLLALFLPRRESTLALLFGSGLLFPLGLVVSKFLSEDLLDNRNPLARLMGLAVLMVNLLWALHVSLLVVDPDYLPLSLGIGLGLHWIIFSWVIQHPVGIVHAVMRTALVTGLWWAFPSHRLSAVAAAVVVAYLCSIWVLSRRKLVSEATGDCA